jgi:hypothetical protein
MVKLVGRRLPKRLTIDKSGNKAMISGAHVGWKEGGWAVGEGVDHGVDDAADDAGGEGVDGVIDEAGGSEGGREVDKAMSRFYQLAVV